MGEGKTEEKIKSQEKGITYKYELKQNVPDGKFYRFLCYSLIFFFPQKRVEREVLSTQLKDFF